MTGYLVVMVLLDCQRGNIAGLTPYDELTGECLPSTQWSSGDERVNMNVMQAVNVAG